MRGTPICSTRKHTTRRFIPAHAGNTEFSSLPVLGDTVHPRACGEHALSAVHNRPHAGSSPRMRGTPATSTPGLMPGRFIPAHAGNTGRHPPRVPVQTVHPRACGEHCDMHRCQPSGAGSSPRMRGTHPGGVLHPGHQRFIPAHAGNTVRPTHPRRGCAVHPRACGEHHRSPCWRGGSGGSSPRMRGTLKPRDYRQQRCRFIPAHAGNTSRNALSTVANAVHPRACGEHIQAITNVAILGGSSPRMRGTRVHQWEMVTAFRFIPAHAGNT